VNILAIPLVSLMVVPLALMGVLMVMLWPSLGVLLLKLADTLLAWFVDGLTLVVNSGAAVWHSGALGWPLPVFVGMACIVLLMPRGIVPKWLAFPLLLPLWWSADAARPPPGHVQLQFLDVGQGLAVVVHTHSHDLLFDTGPADGERFDAGNAVIIPYLRQRSVSRLAKVVVSHWHQDHSGGLLSVLQGVSVGNILSGSGQSPISGSVEATDCRAGQQWQWDDVQFSMLGPANRPYRNINDGSCVLLIEAGSHRALLTGDIEREAENHLLLQMSAGLRADVLQAPHHGSNSSSSEAFLQAVQPSLVVISAGYRNRFSHPSTEVLRRYAEHDIEVYQNVRDGAVQVELGGDEVRISARHRLHSRRYWHNIP
jgi:competence protein ComEC